MNNLTIWCTYHDDSQIEQYHLCNTETLRLFKGTNVDIGGNNINHLNKFYSEIVTLYWVWKNDVQSKRVGFCHYRRRFGRILDFGKGCCQVLAINYHCNVLAHYKCAHNYHDMYDMIDILNDMYGKDNKYSRYLLGSDVFIPFCSFVMYWEDFSRLCDFFFPILFEWDRRNGLDMTPSKYMEKAKRDFRYDNVDYQCRAVSFLAERIISCWLFCEMEVYCLNAI